MTITDFNERAFHESEEFNLLQSGKTWLGDKMTNFSNQKTFSFTFPNLITTVPVKLTTALAANSINGSTTIANINGQTPPITSQFVAGISPGTYVPVYNRSTITGSQFINSSQINVTYTFSAPSDPSGSAAAYLDFFELNLSRSLSLSGDAMTFRNVASVGSGNISNFILSNASSSTKVWDITDIGNIVEMTGSLNGSQFSFTTPTETLKEFVSLNSTSSFANPTYVSKVENQNLHAIGEPDMIIVTHDDFFAASNDLAEYHRTTDHITVDVVKTSQIYNEFGSGKPDISAIRDFVKMPYDRAGGDTSLMPRYLLLMGDGSYDPQNRIASKTNFVPTYQSDDSNNPTATYTSDDFYGLLDDNEGGNITNAAQKLDIGIGRIPVETATEAQDVVNKIKGYKTIKLCAGCAQVASNNTWRNNITFIADDEDNDLHLDASEALAEATRAKYPSYNYDKIYLDAFKQVPTPAGDRYPDVNTAIINRVNTGALIINWVGHGGPTNWAHERIFNMSDIVNFQNATKLPLFITATCDFSAFDLAERTAGEWLIVNGKGGAIGSITTVRLVYSNANQALNDVVFKYLFQDFMDRKPTLGEVTMLSKNNVLTDISNTRKFTLLGDPALTLNYPRYNVVTTMVNEKPVVLPQDSFKALARMTVSGEIRDDNNVKMTSFNGTIYPWVYDKINVTPTLSNDGGSPVRNIKMYKSLLFKGKASVTNGEFSFTFIVPKDINYQYGYGRISYYADNGDNIDAHGFNQTITIGGSADSVAMDNLGPRMNVYMNDEKFVFGGTTNANPLLLVKFDDESGINTVGNGVGHDLTAVLDDNEQNKLTLNDYYESELDNFQKGAVRYPLTKLKDGRHTLKVKAWDINNNSSDEYTEFIVTSDAKIALTHVFNYPNPFTTRTQFMFEHNRPCDVLDVSVQIYTVSGKLVKSIVQQVQSVGYRVDNIEWNGLDDYGDPIGKGVYVYKVNVRDSGGSSAHKFEKLVVLR
ncbi:MAG: type IX secretion system sortase PorU [Bacteroidetes bacterium]|nr:type IX secretion system sortase PorU [Bacteroidota bacterium]